jgi:L,D-transpeptidase ErfK/SrfK
MTRLRVALACVLALTSARAAMADYDEEVFQRKAIPAYSIPTPTKSGGTDTVIGQVRAYRIRKGDTLLDVARYFDLGWNEIIDANPYIDPWVPPAGATILLPTEWVLPCCSYDGVVVNIPEMRLFFFHRSKDDPRTTVVHTFPVGLGRDDWRTPTGKFKIRGKTLNPQWNIPESIRKEHIADRGDPRTFIAGGDPENPLGRHRIELTLPMYGIHGTNIPWGVGMQVSHGCVRLYPEDIERLFPLVPIGAPGEFTYQPVKAGLRDGAVYLEAHNDIYGHAPAPYREAVAAMGRAGLADRADEQLLLRALEDRAGMPLRITPEPGEAAVVPASTAAPEAGQRVFDDGGIPRKDDGKAADD